MKFKRLPDLKTLYALFSFDDTGSLKWKSSGKEAGYLSVHGYYEVRINRSLYKKHRILYYLYHGVDPANLEVDHKDLNKQNNCKTNLRLGTKGNNSTNKICQSNNKSGCKGVYKTKLGWRVQIWFDKQCKSLGTYKSYIYACVVRKRAAKLYHGDWRRE